MTERSRVPLPAMERQTRGGNLDRQAKVATRRGENDFHSMACPTPCNCKFPLRREPRWQRRWTQSPQSTSRWLSGGSLPPLPETVDAIAIPDFGMGPVR